jgi:hypothetical protein
MMERMWGWFVQNWASFFGTAGIIASLLFTAVSLRADTKSRRVSNLITITQSHREMWKVFIENPTLARVFDPGADIAQSPVTREEEIFANLVLVHLSSVYQAMKSELLTSLDGLQRDVGAFFTLPIPMSVWEKNKLLQNQDFAEFVDECLGRQKSFPKEMVSD